MLLYAGDILALSISNLDSLVQMPLGCGEQNMIHFAPSVYVLQYLDKSAQDNKETRSRALGYMKEGQLPLHESLTFSIQHNLWPRLFHVLLRCSVVWSVFCCQDIGDSCPTNEPTAHSVLFLAPLGARGRSFAAFHLLWKDTSLCWPRR